MANDNQELQEMKTMFAVVYDYDESPSFYETDLSQEDFLTWAKSKLPGERALLFSERPFFISDESDIETLTLKDAKKEIDRQKRREYVKEHNKKIDDQIRLLNAKLPARTASLNLFTDQSAIQLLIEEGYKEIARTSTQIVLVKKLEGYDEAYTAIKDQLEELQKQRLTK